MNGRRAKIIRKQIYGTDFSPRHREYKSVGPKGMIVADDKRRAYQQAKRVRRPA